MYIVEVNTSPVTTINVTMSYYSRSRLTMIYFTMHWKPLWFSLLSVEVTLIYISQVEVNVTSLL